MIEDRDGTEIEVFAHPFFQKGNISMEKITYSEKKRHADSLEAFSKGNLEATSVPAEMQGNGPDGSEAPPDVVSQIPSKRPRGLPRRNSVDKETSQNATNGARRRPSKTQVNANSARPAKRLRVADKKNPPEVTWAHTGLERAQCSDSSVGSNGPDRNGAAEDISSGNFEMETNKLSTNCDEAKMEGSEQVTGSADAQQRLAPPHAGDQGCSSHEWNAMYEKLRAYKYACGHIMVDEGFNPYLALWTKRQWQLSRQGSLPEDCLAKLNCIGFFEQGLYETQKGEDAYNPLLGKTSIDPNSFPGASRSSSPPDFRLKGFFKPGEASGTCPRSGNNDTCHGANTESQLPLPITATSATETLGRVDTAPSNDTSPVLLAFPSTRQDDTERAPRVDYTSQPKGNIVLVSHTELRRLRFVDSIVRSGERNSIYEKAFQEADRQRLESEEKTRGLQRERDQALKAKDSMYELVFYFFSGIIAFFFLFCLMLGAVFMAGYQQVLRGT